MTQRLKDLGFEKSEVEQLLLLQDGLRRQAISAGGTPNLIKGFEHTIRILLTVAEIVGEKE